MQRQQAVAGELSMFHVYVEAPLADAVNGPSIPPVPLYRQLRKPPKVLRFIDMPAKSNSMPVKLVVVADPTVGSVSLIAIAQGIARTEPMLPPVQLPIFERYGVRGRVHSPASASASASRVRVPACPRTTCGAPERPTRLLLDALQPWIRRA